MADVDDQWPTFRELEAFVAVAKFGSWAEATQQLGLANKYVTERVVKRLAKKWGVEGDRLVVDMGDRVLVPPEFHDVVAEIEQTLLTVGGFQQKLHPRPRVYRLRVDMYPSHVESFAGRVLGEFEEKVNNRVQIEFVPSFGFRRASGGSGMVRAVRDRRVDLAIAPLDPASLSDENPVPWPEPDDRTRETLPVLRMKPAHRWALVAAVHPSNKLLKGRLPKLNVLPVSQLNFDPNVGGPMLMGSPRGHRTRETLELHHTAHRRFHFAATNAEPAALVALGASSDRVPLIASDSYAPVFRDARNRDTFEYERAEPPAHWPAIVDSRTSASGEEELEVLGGQFGIYWRENQQPRELVPLLRQLADQLADASATLERATIMRRWRDLAWPAET